MLRFLSSKLIEVNESLKQGEKIYNEVEKIAGGMRFSQNMKMKIKLIFIFYAKK